jgi:hypothetical protein
MAFPLQSVAVSMLLIELSATKALRPGTGVKDKPGTQWCNGGGRWSAGGLTVDRPVYVSRNQPTCVLPMQSAKGTAQFNPSGLAALPKVLRVATLSIRALMTTCYAVVVSAVWFNRRGTRYGVSDAVVGTLHSAVVTRLARKSEVRERARG